MPLRCQKFFAAKSIAFCLRKLFRRSCQNSSVGTALVSDESWVVVDGNQTSQTAEPLVNEDTEPQPADAIQQPPVPPNCSRLQSGDIRILDTCPARAGAFTDVWDGFLAGDRVAIKSYRLCSTTDPTQARMRFYKEALACSLLSHQNIVPFRAAYTTLEHPLALVYDFMEHRSLKEYLKDGGIKRVPVLADVAQGLFHMHDLGIIHGNLKTNNILIDLNGTAHIAGLGSAFVPSQNHAAWSEMDVELLFYGTAPELMCPRPPGSRIRTTKECDIYAFALLAWELFAERVPFSDRHHLAAIHLLANGTRPLRPLHPELSDEVWNMIEKCWHNDPAHRLSIKDVLAILRAEI
ncbi:kinase-like protein [Thelephora ganbajun]|uniref:Kinase-like protein n=1 Tax=Thelephora ganbajun TaxID=370292 RepID=A0ACB6ZQJ6_THEGA|nr:kinase-like protein [Thelephora ganbajun]